MALGVRFAELETKFREGEDVRRGQIIKIVENGKILDAFNRKRDES